MAQHGWTRFALCVDRTFCMYLVDMGLLGKTSDDDHSLSTRFLDDLYEVALKTTSELVQHLITVDTILAYSPKADTVAVFAPLSVSDLIHETVGYYSSKAKITILEHGLDRHLLSLAINEFLFQSLAFSSASAPVLRVKDLFIFGHFYKSTEAGAREPAYSMQVATNTDYINRILVDVKIQAQSVAFRSLFVPSNYCLEEEEEPLRCVVLPSLKMALIKAYSDRIPEESSKTSWVDFVDFYERHHKIHLADELEDRGFATIVVNNATDPTRFTNAYEDIVPAAMLWSESGLSRRDLHGEHAELLSRFVISKIAQIASKSAATGKTQIFFPLLSTALPDVLTQKTDELVERKKEARAKGPGFVKSSVKSSQSEESGLDTSFSTEPSLSQVSTSVYSMPSQIEQENPFQDCFDTTWDENSAPTLETVLSALKAPSRSSTSSKPSVTNKPVVFRNNVRLGTRLAPGKPLSGVSAPFVPLTPQNATGTKSEPLSSTPPSNPKKRKMASPSPTSSPQKAFQPPRPKIPKV